MVQVLFACLATAVATARAADSTVGVGVTSTEEFYQIAGGIQCEQLLLSARADNALGLGELSLRELLVRVQLQKRLLLDEVVNEQRRGGELVERALLEASLRRRERTAGRARRGCVVVILIVVRRG